MFEMYEKYLQVIDESLNKFFEAQKLYIHCKKGCSYCCEEGEYPFSRLEFEYAMHGFDLLDEQIKKNVLEKVERLKIEKSKCKGQFIYECPFLFDKKCCIYNYRGMICRNHGLMQYYTSLQTGERKYNIPDCVKIGLNYSEVYDEKTKTISSKLWKKSRIEQEPVSHNVEREFLIKNNLTEKSGLYFGESKFLIDWL